MGGTVRRTIIVTSEFKVNPGNISQIDRLAKAQGRVSGANKKVTSTFGTLRGGLTRARIAYFNLAILLGTVALVTRALIKPTIELETRMVGVAKTTGLTNVEIETLKDELIDLSKTLPTSVNDLADIAKVAGQLGIAKEDIGDFTRSIALIATVTDMTAEEAATNFAKLANAFNLPVFRIIQLGNVVNELENTTAATSREIISSLTRVGAAASTLGISFEQSSAAVATLISAGMRAERAGTRLRALFTQMAKDVDDFSKIAGVSMSEFRQIMEEDGDKALNLVIQGLIDAETGAINTAQAFDAAGRVGGFALITLANNVKDLSENMNTVNTQMEANTSIIQEMEKFLGSTSAQWTIFKNLIVADTMIIGESVNKNMIKPLLSFLLMLGTGSPFSKFTKEFDRAQESLSEGLITPEQFQQIQISIDPLLRIDDFVTAAFVIRNLIDDFIALGKSEVDVQEKTKETINVFDDIADATQEFIAAKQAVIDVDGKSIEQRENDLTVLEKLREEITEQFSNTYPNLLKVLDEVFKEEGKLIEQTQRLNKELGKLPGSFGLLPPEFIRGPTPEEEATSTFGGPNTPPEPPLNDFIARPGQPIQSFSPDDTIVGVKDPSSITNSNNRNITINVNGAGSPGATATEIRRQLSSLA